MIEGRSNLIERKNIGDALIISILILVIIAVFTLSLTIVYNSKIKDNNNTGNDEEDDEVIKVPTEEELKLEKLENINEKLDFFKMEYLDRYIAYKEKNPDLDLEKVILYVNIGLDNPYYENSKDSPNVDTNTVIVNKYYHLPSDYVPSGLEEINPNYSSGKKLLQRDARIAFENLAKDAKSEGLSIIAMSTYRSYEYQEKLYNDYVKLDGMENADTYSARPGYSEHQTALVIDVYNGVESYENFGSTKEFEWMTENAYKYGFILRYPENSEMITGYQNEAWHYRYVGVEIATYMHDNPMTFEEYFARFLD